ncbi:discoidin domain-containing protein [Luteolibacter pohnpeiensis]|uniref:beta-galactosidase n=1 Tax=Luteolibacter pohnpeiensis TaxID=454153 RepID=A0A934S8L8_9BACT|nr:glycoside hydrolase family 2 TIM barrel-domain containing protein [Luteolibacter pohnpeiensis]MBK1881697.1 discoidin domain-containing protein [Luteolibacter pohnpeiensis]
MNSTIIRSALLALSLTQLMRAAPLPPEIENAEALGENKEAWHATLMPYADLKEALTADRYTSSYAKSLNGTWKFHYVNWPKDRPEDFYKPEYDVSGWDDIAVPSNWQVKGYGTPYYRNFGYTFKIDPPRVMSEPPRNYTAYEERNPVGSYVKTFEIPENWEGRRVHINFDGVDSAFFLWINGQKVGYSTNSRNVAEFDITPYIKRGETNTLAAEVYRYCSGSYLEDQDMWRLSGIFRNVTLWAPNEVAIRDFTVVTDLDKAYRDAELKVSAIIRNSGKERSKSKQLIVGLYDQSGKPVPGVSGKVTVDALDPNSETTVSVNLKVSDPLKWTAETPNLYTVVLGFTGDSPISSRVGFRKVEIKDRVFTINGVPVKLKGANRHEHWPDSGHTVTREQMIRDIEVLKQANCNHVRTCHYSDDPQWYELCDEYGLYLVAEANVECHGMQSISDDKQFEKAFVDRNVANVENFKNHPSVVIWSLGNECGRGQNLRSALAAVKAIDDTRPTHYEGFGIGGGNPADIDSRMYASIDEMKQAALSNNLTKPFYQCEYAHAMFNSMGSIGEYNDVFDKYPQLMGGAVWEWMDQGLWNRRNPNRIYLAYGGGFGEYPNNHYFIHKGVVFSDRSPKPHYPEMKRAYQWIAFDAVDAATGKIKVKNKFAFTNIGKYTGTWNITEDGKVIQSGEMPALDLAPGKEKAMTLGVKNIQAKPGAIYHLNLTVSLAKDEPWAKAGYDIANGQFEIPVSRPAEVASEATMKPLKLEDGSDEINVTGEGFSVSFDKNSGTISKLIEGNTNLLLPNGGPKLHLWRSAHRNDDDYAAGLWSQLGLGTMKTDVLSIKADQVDDKTVRVTSSILLTGNRGFTVNHTAAFLVCGDGSVTVDNAVVCSDTQVNLARMGVRMLLDKRLNGVAYLARGPMENYSDRKRGSDIGFYTSTVPDMMTPYSKPMENGNHEDLHWLALGGDGMPQLLVQALGQPMQFSALPYSDEEMDPAEYLVDLPESSQTVLCLGSKTLGVGSNSCGPRPLPQYRVYSEPAEFSYSLRVLPEGETNVREIARELPPQNRAHPVLASRDKDGNVELSAEGDKISYSTDGKLWTSYSKPFPLKKAALLSVRSNAANGQSIENSVHFPAFVDRRNWKIRASSYQKNEGEPEHAIDDDNSTIWHSSYNPQVNGPHDLILDLGEETKIQGISELARNDSSNGRANHYEVYCSTDGKSWGDPAAKGSLPNEDSRQTIMLKSPQSVRYIKFVILDDHSNGDFGSVADLSIVPVD